MAESAQASQSCILFATADWDEPYWTNKQHCAKSLAELGTKVLYVESVGLRGPKANSAKDWGRLWNRMCKGLESLILGAQERTAGIYVLSPLLIPAGHRRPWTRALNRFLLKSAIARSGKQRNIRNPLIWTYHPFMLDVIEGMDCGPVLYHCVDDLAALPGVDGSSFLPAENALLRRAQVVFATAPALAEHCRRHNVNTHYMSNVVDLEHFCRALESGPIPSDLEKIPEPRLCYHGVLSDFKIDFQLLLNATSLKPEWSWVFIGEEREGQNSPLVAELKTRPNVYFLGYKPYAQLPDYLRGMQVGLLPSLINNYTRGMFPMKYFEFIAAGIRVVATPLDFAETCPAGLITAQVPQDFVAAVTCQLASGGLTREESRDIVGENTWYSRTKKMLDIVRQSS